MCLLAIKRLFGLFCLASSQKNRYDERMKLEYPILSIDIGKLLTEKSIRGVRVKEIFFEDGEFTLITERA